MLRLKLLVSFCIILAGNAGAQSIGINSTGSIPDTSAALDIDFPDKGLLIPRVGLTDVTDLVTIKLPATGLIVYNTNAAINGGNGAGFYFYNGSKWSQVSGTSGNWGLTGNKNTLVSANFLGTSDATDLLIKTNGTEALRVTASGDVGIGVAAPSAKFSVGANSQFQVNASGNMVKLNNVDISFPAAQGGAGTQLTNDGAGNLSWSNAASGSLPFVLVNGGAGNVTITDALATGTAVTYGASMFWTAPKTGNVLVTWYKIAPYCFPCSAGHLGFGFRLNGAGNNMNFITSISRFGGGGGGDIVYAPIIEVFPVTAGTVYEITMFYFAQSWSSCMVNTRGNSNGYETFKIEYFQ